jgi:hypothetical protein
MGKTIVSACVLAMLTIVSPGAANATCGEECDGQYASEIDDCHSQYGDDPRDADDLTNCIQEARDNYRSCLDDCASAAISVPQWRKLTAYGFALSLIHQIAPVCSGRTVNRDRHPR